MEEVDHIIINHYKDILVPSVNIPDTIIIKNDDPVVWYFMHKGLLKKKSQRKLKMEIIVEHFTKRILPSGIVAVFLKTNYDEQPINRKVVFEYFQKDELGD